MIEKFIDDYLKNYEHYKECWNYEDGCVLKGACDLYKCTGEKKYIDFVIKYMEDFIDDKGNIKSYDYKNYRLDDINSGKCLFDLYEITKNEKYGTAISNIYEQIKNQPRTCEGNFWHKEIYPYQVWLDGLYMAMPFYARYIIKYNCMKKFEDIYSQFMNVRRIMRDKKTGLYYHGYDESRKEAWSDKNTGLSKNFWGRAEGWLIMAMADVIEYMDEPMKQKYNGLIIMFKEAVDSILKYQDADTKMWYQVIDKKGDAGNYAETSASLMMAYGILKGCNLGVLPQRYKVYGTQALNGTLEKYMNMDNGKASLAGICKVAGLGNNPYRDGSYNYYISEKTASNDPKGVGTLMMVYGQILKN